MNRKIEIRDPRLGGQSEHEVVFTTEFGPEQSTGHVEGLTTGELCRLWMAADERLRGKGIARWRIARIAEEGTP